MKNILITGIPRAGTTLAASLLDAQSNSVCLNEPAWHHPHPKLDAAGFARAIKADVTELRTRLLSGVPVLDRRAADGSALTNYYGTGTKKNFVMHPLVRKNLTPDFTLGIKHNGPYLAVLPELIALGSFEIRAVIRHPLPVLRSWRRLSLPISQGQMPNAIAYWPEMKSLTEATMDLLEKQVRMLDLMVARIRQYEQHLTLVRYEDITHDDGQLSSQTSTEDADIIDMLRKYAPNALHNYPL